ncbi:DinB family protein [Nocardioides sp. BP30]|uniref:DinB family protein n=1 Tax=Nocardioides sp. BP30 TaxID=3036374 RepID=UPI0024686B0A|nr:DinB family protein [Nocardioides sp. BP30]WGL52521.1 DinB family protein [Nocardioides sp. BP30]
MTNSEKDALKRYLRTAREAVLWKTEGLSERDLRLPRTGTGTSLIGIVKHCLNVEAGYFGVTFGRTPPMSAELVPLAAYDEDPQVDWYATEEDSAAELIDLYRRVGAYVEATLDELPFDTVGRVPWWPPERAEIALSQLVAYVLADIARHAGQADILREQIDGAAGLSETHTNLPADADWPAYVEKLSAIAHGFPDDDAGDGWE